MKATEEKSRIRIRPVVRNADPDLGLYSNVIGYGTLVMAYLYLVYCDSPPR
jgi:hypothetical protein